MHSPQTRGSTVESHHFFTSHHAHTIAQGEKLSPQAEKLLCDTAITMKIRKAQARQIAGYCSGATRLLDQ